MQVGRIVISKSGRDKDNWFVVIKVEDQFVYIVDGKIRKLENPKKKNIKHLQKTNMFLKLDEINKNFEALTNKKLKKIILDLKH
ncbi:MAG: KOW domain-containing RNA-binding protein [Oscillospiraceae bacterium]|nr:KOW domain-containing RNA-binding protein [Oscillospiraceae bacterium]